MLKKYAFSALTLSKFFQGNMPQNTSLEDMSSESTIVYFQQISAYLKTYKMPSGSKEFSPAAEHDPCLLASNRQEPKTLYSTY